MTESERGEDAMNRPQAGCACRPPVASNVITKSAGINATKRGQRVTWGRVLPNAREQRSGNASLMQDAPAI